MIKFFGRIRQNLLSEGKTGKYLKYAIGEIFLVVVGILVALWINNLNRFRVVNLSGFSTKACGTGHFIKKNSKYAINRNEFDAQFFTNK